MSSNSTETITEYLERVKSGDETAMNAVVSRVQPVLKRIAASLIWRLRAQSLDQPSGVVNEAWQRLLHRKNQRNQFPANRQEFFRNMSRMMTDYLIDEMRKANKRQTEPLQEEQIAAPKIDIVAILDCEAALEQLGLLDAKDAELFRMRFYDELTFEQIAAQFAISKTSVFRRYQFVLAWITRHLRSAEDNSPSHDQG